MRYVLTQAARDDILGVIEHISTIQNSPQNARLVAMRLRTLFRKLVRIPQLGQPRKELRDRDARVVSVTGLLVVYDPKSKPLSILRVVHAARDLSRIQSRIPKSS